MRVIGLRSRGAIVSAAGLSVALAASAAACGGGSSSTAPAISTASTAASPGGSGCGRAAPSGSTTLAVYSGGRTRVVIVHVPTGYIGTSKVALVLNLHGSGSTARAQELFSGMDTTSDEDGFVVAYPQALITAGTGFDWNIPGVPLIGGSYPQRDAANDVAFLSGLARQLEARYCVDTSRVYVTGMSGGGRMASQLACDASGTFASAAPVAGLRAPSPCPSARPVPIIAFHGTADPVDPYEGHGQPYWIYSVPLAAQRWGAFNHCRATPQTTSGNGYTLTQYAGCAAGASVELYSLVGEGHEWPGGPPQPSAVTRVLGPQTQAVNADAVMWAFFEAHPLPRRGPQTRSPDAVP